MSTLDEATRVLLAQSLQLSEAEFGLAQVEAGIEQASTTAASNRERLMELDRQMAELFAALEIPRESGVLEGMPSAVQLSARELAAIRTGLPTFRPLETLDGTDWDSLVTDAGALLAQRQIDLERDPLDLLLSARQQTALQAEYDTQFGRVPWTRGDFAAVALAATVASLVDYFVVSIPKDMVFKGQEYSGSAVTKKLRAATQETLNPDSESRFARWAGEHVRDWEAYAKVPYDIESKHRIPGLDVDGLRPGQHRFMSPSHDPALGIVWSVIDQLRGICTLIGRDGTIHFVGNPTHATGNLLIAIKKGFLHMLSDIPTSAGIQPPFFTLTQLMTGKSPFVLREGGDRVSYADAARFMYGHGYTLEHFVTMSLVPLIVEASVRVYFRAAHFDTLYEADELVWARHRAKQVTMLTMAHGLATSGNLLKTYLMGMNPLALNWAELLALTRSFLGLASAYAKKNEAVDAQLARDWRALRQTALQQAYLT